MRIGVQTGGLEEYLGMEGAMRAIRKAGFDAIDLNLDHLLNVREVREGKRSEFFALSDEEMKERLAPWKRTAEEIGLEIYQAHAPFSSYVGDEDIDEYLISVQKKVIMLCDYFHCRHLIVHPAFLPYQQKLDYDVEHAANIHMYTALIPAMKQYGVEVCLENMFSGNRRKMMSEICSDPHEAAAYIDELNAIAGENIFGFCFDVGHATLMCNDVLATMRILGKRITAFHIHDNDGWEDQHLLPYSGVTNWDRFCQGVREIGYTGVLSFETVGAVARQPKEVCQEVLNLAAAIAKHLSNKIEQI